MSKNEKPTIAIADVQAELERLKRERAQQAANIEESQRMLEQMVANLNAYDGAIQFAEQLLERLNGPNIMSLSGDMITAISSEPMDTDTDGADPRAG